MADLKVDYKTGTLLRKLAEAGDDPRVLVRASGLTLEEFEAFLKATNIRPTDQKAAEQLLRELRKGEARAAPHTHVTRKVLRDRMAKELHWMKKEEVSAVLEATFEVIREALAQGEDVDLRGFGTFKVRHKKARFARNPRTGERIRVPARAAPVFKPSRDLVEHKTASEHERRSGEQ